MKLQLLALTLIFAAPAFAQTAPAGWQTQTRDGGARTFMPRDLETGEIFKVTIYDVAALDGQTPGAWLRKFGGPVGKGAGSLAEPMEITERGKLVAVGSGAYRGPNGSQLGALFQAVSADGARVYAARALFSSETVLARYRAPLQEITAALAQRAMQSEQVKPATLAGDKKAGEDARYQWTTTPGKGIQSSQIAGVVWSFQVNGIGADEEVYLLLKDGTIHRGLPVAPDEIDLSKSRAGEPRNWGKWRAKGAGYEVSWSGAGWENLEAEKAFIAADNARLSGRFGGGMASNNFFASSWASWGMSFDDAGRFWRDKSGGNVDSTFGNSNAIITRRDDKGSETMIGDRGGASSTTGKTDADRNGSYSVQGATMTLRYDNGRIERLPFLFLDKEREIIWLGDGHLMKDKK